MSDLTFRHLLNQLIAGQDLTYEDTRWAFGELMEGRLSEAQTAGLLTALAAKGETVDEICGAAQAMREHVVRIDGGRVDIIDTCGTGGTGISTFNISTAVSFVLAGAGLTVAKHGNRTNTRASGSANVLAALGVNIEAQPDAVGRCLREANVCFCFAVLCHPAMKHAVPVRKQLAVRTIFNWLGPLTNPAGAKRQLMGVFDGTKTETIATVLGRLGATRAMVVHAEDGLDELSTVSETTISELADGRVTTSRVRPEQFRLHRIPMDELLVESAEQSAEIIRGVLDGRKGPHRDIVLLNAAAALRVADRADTIADGLGPAAESIDSGRAKSALEKLIAVSNA